MDSLSAAMEKLTPAMSQYLEIKEQHKDSILFFRMGDFYEMFFEDAVLASKVLGIALTSRDREKKIPMCGLPYHACETYSSKLVKQGYKVVICEQTEAASGARKIMSREVTRIITAGTAHEDGLVEPASNNYIAATARSAKGCGFAYMDVTTGEFRLADLPDTDTLIDELRRLYPTELLTPDSSCGEETGRIDAVLPRCSITRVNGSDFNFASSLDRLKRHFNVATLDGFGCADLAGGISAAGALLKYVKESRRAGLDHVNKCSPYLPGTFLLMDSVTRRNLEITESIRTLDRKGSLLGLLDRTRTASGARRLKSWLLGPLVDPARITERLDAVSELIERRGARADVERLLDGVYDLERLIGRVSLGVASPRDLASLKESLKLVPEIRGSLEGFGASLIGETAASLDPVAEVVELVGRAIAEDPPATTRDTGFIRDGFNSELDELREIGSGGKDWIAALEVSERKRTNIKNLKVRYNRVFGYYIEVTKSNLAGVPDDYIRKQTLVNAERFVTPELKEWESKILTAEERAGALEIELFTVLCEDITRYSPRVQTTAEGVSVIDVFCSFASISDEYNYVKPRITGGDSIEITEGRHPVIERGLDNRFVPNDLRLDCASDQLIILTGPNMAGKSTFIRQAALIVVMAQTGCFVPASSAEIGVVDRIFTRVGASDDLTRGQSTFMVEMSETANILNNATSRSLIILDEIGRGTSTFDGLSIAWAVAEYIYDTPGLRAKTLFATHYHELTELSLTRERVKNYNMAVKEFDGRVIFLTKVVPGGSSRSYGIQVAKLAGIPSEVITRAGEILKNLESGELNASGMPRLATRAGAKADSNAYKDQMNLALSPGSPNSPGPGQGVDPVREELEKLHIDTTTPVEALTILSRLKSLLD